ncbi:hypothetical protein C8R43DRAFT_1125331 [Mycena crocata]|nr:hypothetical protein C8R43DRAFT_1125331 [Mycena crocata]
MSDSIEDRAEHMPRHETLLAHLEKLDGPFRKKLIALYLKREHLYRRNIVHCKGTRDASRAAQEIAAVETNIQCLVVRNRVWGKLFRDLQTFDLDCLQPVAQRTE